jgi:tryptophan halogenase
MKRVVIVGSGTAGRVTANILAKAFPTYSVRVVSSEKVPIIGVGEGSTEHWTSFEQFCQINRSIMVAKTEATFKFGIRFKDWNRGKADYFHSISGGQIHSSTFNAGYNYVNSMGKNLTPFFAHPSLIYNQVRDAGKDTLRQSNQFHFDTHKLNSFLIEHAKESKVDVVTGTVEDAILNSETGEISSLVIDGTAVPCDFVIDCTGFHRLILNRLGDPGWVSHLDYLPNDSAMVFQTPSEDNREIKPYTLAQAMSAGWMWEIPTQSRRGNGYVFSSDYISQDEVVIEAGKVSGFTIDNPRFISYDPGYIKRPWIKNCVAIGLSSNFIEPLEATSISSSIQQALLLTSYLGIYRHNDDWATREYQRVYESMMENLAAMICLHYVSNRDDTEYWSDQQQRPKTELLETLLDVCKRRGFESHDIPHTGFELFQAFHFWHVAQGQGLISSSTSKDLMSQRGLLGSVGSSVEGMFNEKLSENVIPHREALERWMTRV